MKALEKAPVFHRPAKLERLRIGYCARDGCEADYYEFHLGEFPGVDWDVVTRRTNDLSIAAEAAAKDETKRQARRKRVRRWQRLGSGVLAIVLLIVLRFVVQHGRLPFAKKPPKYQIDPASVGGKPLH
jgi:hypothetical protein